MPEIFVFFFVLFCISEMLLYGDVDLVGGTCYWNKKLPIVEMHN